MLEQKNITVKAGNSFQTICPFPVGYIYQSYNSTSPANIYGGSWTPITGRFLYCNSGTSVGGSNTHQLTIDEMPRHNHTVDIFMGLIMQVVNQKRIRHIGQSTVGLLRILNIQAVVLPIITCPHIKLVTHGDALHKILKNK